jgi:vancomycin resistance protein YoaR
LFTTKIEGDKLIFEFYGTKDGRTVEITPDPPAIYNITSADEPRYIETDELPPGEKKLVEHSHRGADTYFDYIVTYPDGTVKEKRFYSHYVAWPEVWLVGKQPATSTDETLDEKTSTQL